MDKALITDGVGSPIRRKSHQSSLCLVHPEKSSECTQTIAVAWGGAGRREREKVRVSPHEKQNLLDLGL